MSSSLKVGEVAEQAGVGVQTLHYYERLGLLPKPGRSAANYRLYSPEAVRRVRFIKKAQALGLNLQEIKEVLDLRDRRKAPCGRVAALAEKRFEEIDRQIAELRAFRRELAKVLPKWREETAVERVCAGEFCDLVERLPLVVAKNQKSL